MRVIELPHSDSYVRKYWVHCRRIGVPGELHGGKHRRSALAMALALCCDLIDSNDRPYVEAYTKAYEWLTVGSEFATVGCVCTAVYKAWETYDEWNRERAGLTLVLFAVHWNAGYPYWTAYDDAFLRAVNLLDPPPETFKNNYEYYLGDDSESEDGDSRR